MPTTFNGITYTEGRDGEVTVEMTGGSARRTLFCDFEQAQSLCQYFVGGLVYAGGANFYYKAPERHPRYGNLVCTAASYMGIGPLGDNGAGVSTFPKARVTVTYGLPTPQQKNQPDLASQVIITDRRENSASVVVPRNAFGVGLKLKWNAPGAVWDQKIINEHPGFVVPETTWYIQLFGYTGPSINDGSWDAAQGKVNSSSFTKLGKTCATKTLMFQGNSPERSILYDVMGNVIATGWNVTLTLSYRRQGWHKMMGPDGKFYEVKTTDDDDIVELTNFNTLFPF